MADYTGLATSEEVRGLYSGEIYLLEDRDPKFGPGLLLGGLRGARAYPTSERFFPMWSINVERASAYDEEHDGVHLLRLKIENPVVCQLCPAAMGGPLG